jgi:UDP-2-acetamido-3-amino-2,3-dideoxy-glucuronate N-acetyltransferase
MRIAIIGTGYWGSKIVETAKAMDLDVTQYDIKDSLDAITPETTDAAIIATPATTHKSITQTMMSRGINVLVEKPAFMNMSECHEIEPYCQKAKFMSGHILLYSEHFANINVDAKQIRHIESRRLNWGRVQKDISPVPHLAPHDVAVLDVLLGDIPDKIYCKPFYITRRQQPDYVVCDLDYGDTTVQLQIGWLYNDKIRDIRVFVNDGIYDWRDSEDTSHYFDYNGSDKIQGVPKSTSTSLTRQLQAFINFCEKDQEPLSNFAHTKRVTYVIECMEKSLKTGEVICPSKEY